MFKQHRETPLTVLMPNNEAFETWIVAHGGNSTDPESLTTREWRARWSDVFEYFCEWEMMRSRKRRESTDDGGAKSFWGS